MPALPLVLGFGGIGMQATGNIIAANQRADAAAKDAMLKNQQADELHAREAIAEADLARVENETIGAQKDAFGYSGFASSSGMLLSALEQTHSRANLKLTEMKRDANFREQQLRQGADIALELGSQEALAGGLSAAGGVLGGVYNLGDKSGWWNPKKVAQRLPAWSPSPKWGGSDVSVFED